jgi:hypothetical protein
MAGEKHPAASKYNVDEDDAVLAGMLIANRGDAVAVRAVVRKSEAAAETIRLAAVCSIAVC